MKNKQVFITVQLKERKITIKRRLENKVWVGRKELSIFEQMGSTYTEKDGIYIQYPIGEETEAMQNTFQEIRRFMEKVLKENQPENIILVI